MQYHSGLRRSPSSNPSPSPPPSPLSQFVPPPSLLLSASPSPPPPSLPSPSSHSSPSSHATPPPSPLLLSPTSLSSIVELKHRYDTFLTSLASRDAADAAASIRRCEEEAAWRRGWEGMREAHEGVIGDWRREVARREEVEGRVTSMEKEREEREGEWGRREELLRLTREELENERKVVGVLRAQVVRAQREKEEDRGGAKGEEGAEEGTSAEGTEGGGKRGKRTVLLDVENVVLKRRVERLEMELTESRAEAEEQRVGGQMQVEAIERMKEHLEGMKEVARGDKRGESEGREGEGRDGVEGVSVVELELELIRERLARERKMHWQRERGMYVAALIWLIALFTAIMTALTIV